MRTKKCGRGFRESGGASQVVLWVVLGCAVIGAGIFVLQRKPPAPPPVVVMATPIPATPTPPPATPEPVIVKATPTPTPPPVAIATPAPTPATPPPLDFATVARTPALWPPQVALTHPTAFPINMNGRVVGEAKAPAGTMLKVLRLNGVQAEVEFQGGRHLVPVASTDFMARALTIFRNNGSIVPTSVATAPAPMPAMATPHANAKPEASDEQKLASKVVVEVVRNRRARVEGGDFDDKMERVEMKVKFSNPDLYISADKWKGEIYVFAGSVLDRNAVKLIITQQFDVSIPARKSQEFVTEEATMAYDSTGVAKFGFKYDGWVLIVKDSGGKVLIAKASAPSLLKGAEQMSGLAKDRNYDRNTFKEKSVPL